MVSLCFSGPTYRTHFTLWHLTLHLNQAQFSTHKSILLVVCMWVAILFFFFFLWIPRRKIQVNRAGFVINTELHSKTIENVFSEFVTPATEFLLIVPQNVPDSLTCTDRDQGLHRHKTYTDTNTFQRCLYFAALWGWWYGKARGWSSSAVAIHHGTNFSIGDAVSQTTHFQLHTSSFTLALWTTELEVGMQISGCLEPLKNKNKNKKKNQNKTLFPFWDGLPSELQWGSLHAATSPSDTTNSMCAPTQTTYSTET